MKTTSKTHLRGLLAGFALCSLAATPAMTADNTAQTSQSSQNRTIELRRASGFIGLDVMSSDGAKVGDIVDFTYRFDGDPAISHVLIMSGGFLDMGGDVRAVPAAILTVREESARLELSTADFNRAPLVSQDRNTFFADAEQVRQVDDYFRPHLSGEQAPSAPAPTASKAKHDGHVVYSSLHRDTVVGSDGGDLGFVTDVWVNLESNQALLVEINPAAAVGFPFRNLTGLRYELPARKFSGTSEDGGDYAFDIAQGDLSTAPSVVAVDNATLEYGIVPAESVMQLKVSKNNDSQS